MLMRMFSPGVRMGASQGDRVWEERETGLAQKMARAGVMIKGILLEMGCGTGWIVTTQQIKETNEPMSVWYFAVWQMRRHTGSSSVDALAKMVNKGSRLPLCCAYHFHTDFITKNLFPAPTEATAKDTACLPPLICTQQHQSPPEFRCLPSKRCCHLRPSGYSCVVFLRWQKAPRLTQMSLPVMSPPSPARSYLPHNLLHSHIPSAPKIVFCIPPRP